MFQFPKSRLHPLLDIQCKIKQNITHFVPLLLASESPRRNTHPDDPFHKTHSHSTEVTQWRSRTFPPTFGPSHSTLSHRNALRPPLLLRYPSHAARIPRDGSSKPPAPVTDDAASRFPRPARTPSDNPPWPCVSSDSEAASRSQDLAGRESEKVGGEVGER